MVATASLFPVSSPQPDFGAKNSVKHGGGLGTMDVRGIKTKSGSSRSLKVKANAHALQRKQPFNHVKNFGLLRDGFGSTPEMCKNNLFWVGTKMQVLVDRYLTWPMVLELFFSSLQHNVVNSICSQSIVSCLIANLSIPDMARWAFSLVKGLLVTEEKVLEMINNPHCLYCMTILRAISLLAPVMGSEITCSKLLPVVITLSKDSVSNIRFNVAKVLQSFIPIVDQAVVEKTIRPCLVELAEDPDVDVCYFSKQALLAIDQVMMST
ncbi:hypothetical protein L6452_14797 [Arctium lappa]|uniref:Uncharacterized protein n=1 Tax=Arctium lappa TaxID=4217 RepID=A0ACB9CM07_ARCLA|nr:hypothetical protein L6452_14797 [Arctium lappa]